VLHALVGRLVSGNFDAFGCHGSKVLLAESARLAVADGVEVTRVIGGLLIPIQSLFSTPFFPPPFSSPLLPSLKKLIW